MIANLDLNKGNRSIKSVDWIRDVKDSTIKACCNQPESCRVLEGAWSRREPGSAVGVFSEATM